MKSKVMPCPDCNGRGHTSGGDAHTSWSRTCLRCHGTGYVMVPVTVADKIRAMSDEELAEFMDGEMGYCRNLKKCADALDTADGVPREWCVSCILQWLKQPAEEDQRPLWYDDKLHSGLIEEG